MKFKSIIEPLYLKDNLLNYIKYVPGEGEKAHALAIKKHTDYNINNKWYVIRFTRYSINGNGFLSKNYKEILQYKDYEKYKNTKDSLKYYIPFIDDTLISHFKYKTKCYDSK